MYDCGREHGSDPEPEWAYGVVVLEPGRPNLAREIVFEAGLPMRRYCIPMGPNNTFNPSASVGWEKIPSRIVV